MGEGRWEKNSNEQRAMSEKRGESDEAVGRGPRARRFSGNERNQANGTTRAVPERAAFRTVRG